MTAARPTMPIAVHPVHRRLAELAEKAMRLGGYDRLPADEMLEIFHCVQENARFVRRYDELRNLALVARVAGDREWEAEIRERIARMEVWTG